MYTHTQIHNAGLCMTPMCFYASQVALEVKKPPANAADARHVDLIPGSGWSLGVGNGTPLKYSRLENSMDRGAWQAIVHGTAKSQTQLFATPWTIYSPWNSPGQNTGVGSLSLLQGIFPTQGLNPGLVHCRWIPYELRHQEAHILVTDVVLPQIRISYSQQRERQWKTWGGSCSWLSAAHGPAGPPCDSEFEEKLVWAPFYLSIVTVDHQIICPCPSVSCPLWFFLMRFVSLYVINPIIHWYH